MTGSPFLGSTPPSGEKTIWDRWAPWGFFALVLGLGLAIWEVFPPGIWHDDGVYVLLSRALAHGDGLRYVGVPGAPLAPKFPPLYPLVLAPIWIFFPSFPENAGLLGGVNLLCLAASGGIFLAYLRRGLGLPLPWALAAVTLAWTSPALWRVAMVPLSEPLFILTVVLALWAGVRMERGGGGWAVTVFLLAGGLAFYTRSLGVAVLLGGSGALFLRKGRKVGAWGLLGVTGVVLPWVLWSRWAAQALPGPLRDILGPYGGWLFGGIGRDPGAYLLFLLENGGNLLARSLSLLLPGVTGLPLWVGLLLVPLLILGLWEVGRKSLTLPLTLVLALLVILLWPFQASRLLIPFQPLLILGVVLGFRAVLCSGALTLRGRIPVVLLAGGWALLVLSVSAYRLSTGWPGELYRVRSDALARAVRSVEEYTPPEAVVGAPELWPSLHLFTGREVSPSARFLPLTEKDPAWGTPDAQYALWMEVGLTHILVEHGGGVHGEALDRVDARCAPGTVEVLDLQPGQILVALNWDAACRARLREEG